MNEKLNELVFPAASNPNMSNRISLDPKILPIILEIWPPMAKGVVKFAATDGPGFAAWLLPTVLLSRHFGMW